MTQEHLNSEYQALLGWVVVAQEPDQVTVQLPIESRHLNRSGGVHGGVLASLLDTAMSYSGLYSDDPDEVLKSVTLSLTTTFLSPAREGTLTVIGRVRGGGRKIFMSTGEVFDDEGRLIAIGEGSFRRRSDSSSEKR